MRKSFYGFCLAVFGLLALPFQVMAITITPTFTSFGSLPAATFGGSGIPNDSVAITINGNLVLGLTAHQRYNNPPLTHNGAGTFVASIGNDSGNGEPDYARWNFGFFIDSMPTGGYVDLYYDTNPAVGNDVSTFFSFAYFPGTGQDSWNLGMGFLGGATFPESSPGQYGFALIAREANGREVGRSAILVNVGDVRTSVPDKGSTAVLLVGALFGLTLIKSKRQKLHCLFP
jgi:hypothetical protein